MIIQKIQDFACRNTPYDAILQPTSHTAEFQECDWLILTYKCEALLPFTSQTSYEERPNIIVK